MAINTNCKCLCSKGVVNCPVCSEEKPDFKAFDKIYRHSLYDYANKPMRNSKGLGKYRDFIGTLGNSKVCSFDLTAKRNQVNDFQRHLLWAIATGVTNHFIHGDIHYTDLSRAPFNINAYQHKSLILNKIIEIIREIEKDAGNEVPEYVPVPVPVPVPAQFAQAIQQALALKEQVVKQAQERARLELENIIARTKATIYTYVQEWAGNDVKSNTVIVVLTDCINQHVITCLREDLQNADIEFYPTTRELMITFDSQVLA